MSGPWANFADIGSYDPTQGPPRPADGTTWGSGTSAEQLQNQYDAYARYQRALSGHPDLPPSLIAAIQPGYQPDVYNARDTQRIITEALKAWDPSYGFGPLAIGAGTSSGTPQIPPPGPPADLPPALPPILPPTAYLPPTPYRPPPTDTGDYEEAGSTGVGIGRALDIPPMAQYGVGDYIDPTLFPALPPPNANGSYPIGAIPNVANPGGIFGTYAAASGGYNPSLGFDIGGAVGKVGAGLCDYAPEGPLRTACLIANGILTETLGGGGKGTNLGTPGGGSTAFTCPAGWHTDSSGKCVQDGIVGTINRVLPFGQTGTMAGSSGQAVMGGFGIPALVPLQVGTIMRNDGSSGPILRCPAGMVLGKDQLCYMKGAIPRGARKNPPGARPLLSAADGRVLNRAKAVEKRVRSVYSKHAKKPCRCGTARKKK